MRFAWFPMLLVLAVACGDGATIVSPGRYDVLWGDAADATTGRDTGRDARPDPGWPRDDGATDAGDPDASQDDLPFLDVPPDADRDPGIVDDIAEPDLPESDDAGVGDPGPADDVLNDPGSSDPGPSDPGSLDPGFQDPGPLDPGTPDPGFDPGFDPGVVGDTLSIRFVAANLTSGSDQSYDPGHGIRLMAGCRADVLLVQEFNYGDNSAADYREMTDAICGTECRYSVGTGQIPNGVVSRWPIVASGYWDDPNISNRDLDWARIDLPGDRDLFSISVHLKAGSSREEVEWQMTAAQVVARKVTEHRAANPGCCWYVVGGDFNGPSAVSNSGFGMYDGEPVFAVAGPHPVGEDGLEGTNASREKQYDFVLLDRALRAWQVPSVFPANDGAAALTYPDGLVFDSRDFSQTQLNRHFAPALTGDSAASNMQHMAVVKDVVIPR
ncbi:MAG TPA: endonuclease [Myxococcota bacterium]|nr:endonuclease [Myxococcota bacterium]